LISANAKSHPLAQWVNGNKTAKTATKRRLIKKLLIDVNFFRGVKRVSFFKIQRWMSRTGRCPAGRKVQRKSRSEAAFS
jgi:hypothetical protein